MPTKPYAFRKIDAEQRRAFIEDQVTQFEKELFAHQLNRIRLIAAGLAEDSEQVKQVDNAIEVIIGAIAATSAEADKQRD